ncbi:pre-mRNA-splicing factor ATP-dependent RNA helicase PRP43 [Fusarium pseudocircinatum]|uniref:Pre-mRNA-splicing factor ATP-dependent RNA helicase PRP43 n=1 Tax=Fusarium pseudocircinatum TaxID=56676 RepID=A0A8H5KTG7_9HYPO|nr:pre-mRNA-splicing factor ATP-dependent RNA helicase PRP43 [Fusarium pseudocircinatum]
MAQPTMEHTLLMSVLKYEVARENPLRRGVNRSPSYFETLSQYRNLPIRRAENFVKFLRHYKEDQVVVLAPEKGCGDTAQLTKRILYLELDRGLQVVCTQPSPVVAKELSERVSAELEVTFGEQVGVQYRKHNKTSNQTRLKFVTEGMLLQLIGNNPTMAGYSSVILDFYEPTTNVDPLLALLKRALPLNPDLTVIIISEAESQKFATYFNVPQTVGLGGTPFPVGISYINDVKSDYCEEAFRLVKEIHKGDAGRGGILVFLASNFQVNHAVAKLRGAIPDMETFPWHGSLSEAEKAKALGSGEKRRCVITTNIAETSIAVAGIVYVVGKSIDILTSVEKLTLSVDAGVEMQSLLNPDVGVWTIQAGLISKSSADQRAACAGQTQPGQCFRLYSMETYNKTFSEVSPPNILKDCFLAAMLALKSAGINSVGTFDFLDPANQEIYLRGLKDVSAMNLIDEVGIAAPAGKAAATLPIDLTWYNAFDEAIKLGCLSELIGIAALASVKNPIFLRPHETQHAAGLLHRQFMAPLSDHMTELNTLYTYLHTKRNMSTEQLATWCNETLLSSKALEEALHLREGLIRWCKTGLGVSEISGLTPHDKDYHVNICKAITKGFFHHAAIRDASDQPGQYRTMKYSPVWIHPNSALGSSD